MSIGLFLLLVLVFLIMLAIVVAVMAHSHSLTVQAMHAHITTLETSLKAHAENAMKDVRQYTINEVTGLKMRLSSHASAIALVQKAQAEAKTIAADLSLPAAQPPAPPAPQPAGTPIMRPDGSVAGAATGT